MEKHFIEFLGSFFLMLALGLSGNPLVIGGMLMGLLLQTDGHFNPLVSLSYGLKKIIPFSEALINSLLQIFGGVLATLLVLFLSDETTEIIIKTSPIKIILIEFLFSFLLIYSYLNIRLNSTNQRINEGLAIAFIWMASVLTANNIVQSFFNPMLVVGTAISGKISFAYLGYYLLGEFLGGLFAVFIFKKVLKPS